MFRELGKKKQALTEQESLEILKSGTTGVLAVSGEDGYPYAVPVNYVYHDGAIYLHGAKRGHKMDAIRGNDKVSFCVVEKDELHPEAYTTYFRSVIAFGRAKILEDPQEIRKEIRVFAKRFVPEDGEAEREKVIESEWPALSVTEIRIEHLSGKKSMESI